jgi:cob(I)alamin adenosyltransferase
MGEGPVRDDRGLLLVYTGQGKGKTTAALGVTFRAMGHGWKVAVVQFIKGKWRTGERLFAPSLPNLTFLVMGEGFTWESDDLSRDRRAAELAWQRSRELIHSKEYKLVVLDEITYAVNHGFLDGEEVARAIDERPPGVHVIVTGRHVPEPIAAKADLITDMQNLRHPFERGIRAQIGIDF